MTPHTHPRTGQGNDQPRAFRRRSRPRAAPLPHAAAFTARSDPARRKGVTHGRASPAPSSPSRPLPLRWALSNTQRPAWPRAPPPSGPARLPEPPGNLLAVPTAQGREQPERAGPRALEAATRVGRDRAQRAEVNPVRASGRRRRGQSCEAPASRAERRERKERRTKWEGGRKVQRPKKTTTKYEIPKTRSRARVPTCNSTRRKHLVGLPVPPTSLLPYGSPQGTCSILLGAG